MRRQIAAAATVAALILSACTSSPVEPTAHQKAAAGSPDRKSDTTQAGQNSEPRGFSTSGWKTDFSKRSVAFDEISSGGPPRDGIPPIDRPLLETIDQARIWLKDREPVIVLSLGGQARAYPLQVLIWHEIVNDVVGGTPVVVTFCPLCNTALAFDRRINSQVYDFGTTGNLRNSDLVMWDRQTESWWQQVTGEAIVGEMTGKRLLPLPASIVSFGDFRTGHSGGTVLSRETGFDRAYGRNPYAGYDDVESSPFLYHGHTDGRLRPMDRVVGFQLNGESVAFPFQSLASRRVVQERVGGQAVAVFFTPGTASALDQSSMAASRDIGAVGVFVPAVAGRQLTFQLSDNRIQDAETGSIWNVLGQAVEGELRGTQLEPVVHGNHFWFAMAAFYPNVRIWHPTTPS